MGDESALNQAPAEPALAQPQRTLAIVKSWSLDRWLAIAGILVAVVCAWWAILASDKAPMLTFAVHPLKTEFKRSDFEKDFGFSYQGKPVDAESVTSIQVAFWNKGNRSIRDSDVLEPVIFKIPNNAKIITSVVKKVSRPSVCVFSATDKDPNLAIGTCRIQWHILEPDDWAVVQIIYAGAIKDPPSVTGAIEGQRAIPEQRYDFSAGRPVITRWRALPLLVFLTVLLVLYMHLLERFERRSKPNLGRFGAMLTIGVIVLLFSIPYVLRLYPGNPPFPF